MDFFHKCNPFFAAGFKRPRTYLGSVPLVGCTNQKACSALSRRYVRRFALSCAEEPCQKSEPKVHSICKPTSATSSSSSLQWLLARWKKPSAPALELTPRRAIFFNTSAAVASCSCEQPNMMHFPIRDTRSLGYWTSRVLFLPHKLWEASFTRIFAVCDISEGRLDRSAVGGRRSAGQPSSWAGIVSCPVEVGALWSSAIANWELSAPTDDLPTSPSAPLAGERHTTTTPSCRVRSNWILRQCGHIMVEYITDGLEYEPT